MKTIATCFECGREGLAGRPSIGLVEFADDGVARFTCTAGHRSAVASQHHRFELLFESGSLALLDGHAREAVSSFAAAFERFLEFYLTVVCRARGLTPELFAGLWRSVASQTERQLGAFLFVFAIENNQAFQLDQRQATFRNRVIHKGYVPTRQEVHAYAGRVREQILECWQPLEQSCRQEIRDIVKEQLIDRYDSVSDGRRTGTSCGVLSLQVNSRVSFGDALEEFREFRDSVHQAAVEYT